MGWEIASHQSSVLVSHLLVQKSNLSDLLVNEFLLFAYQFLGFALLVKSLHAFTRRGNSSLPHIGRRKVKRYSPALQNIIYPGDGRNRAQLVENWTPFWKKPSDWSIWITLTTSFTRLITISTTLRWDSDKVVSRETCPSISTPCHLAASEKPDFGPTLSKLPVNWARPIPLLISKRWNWTLSEVLEPEVYPRQEKNLKPAPPFFNSSTGAKPSSK